MAPSEGTVVDVADLLVPGPTRVMGIVNVTPDSFAEPTHRDITSAIDQGIALAEAGADIIDVGGESTRPGATRVPESAELARVLPVVSALANLGLAVSVDTVRSAVADAAVRAGAIMVNDVSGGLADPFMYPVVATLHVPYVLQHWHTPFDHRPMTGAFPTGHPGPQAQDLRLAAFPGTPQPSSRRRPGPREVPWGPEYAADPVVLPARVSTPWPAATCSTAWDSPAVTLVLRELTQRAASAQAHGVAPDYLVLDPGLGFGKSAADDWALVAAADRLAALGFPVLWGFSRKRFLAQAYDHPTDPWDRDTAGAALTTYFALHGAWAVRTHTVEPHRTAIAVATRLGETTSTPEPSSRRPGSREAPRGQDHGTGAGVETRAGSGSTGVLPGVSTPWPAATCSTAGEGSEPRP